ncbi:hypothetical protein Lal_00027070 [Lupinus albus]|nr:hypothetical protein Lal_00027070 [Lupinus albus]
MHALILKHVQAATKPSFATFFPSVLQALDWTPPFDLECDIAVYALGTVLSRVQKVKCGGHIWHQGHFGHYKWKMCAKVKIYGLDHLPEEVVVYCGYTTRSGSGLLLCPTRSGSGLLLCPTWSGSGLVNMKDEKCGCHNECRMHAIGYILWDIYSIG